MGGRGCYLTNCFYPSPVIPRSCASRNNDLSHKGRGVLTHDRPLTFHGSVSASPSKDTSPLVGEVVRRTGEVFFKFITATKHPPISGGHNDPAQRSTSRKASTPPRWQEPKSLRNTLDMARSRLLAHLVYFCHSLCCDSWTPC